MPRDKQNDCDAAAEHLPFLRQASDSDTPTEILVELARSEDALVRGAVAGNKATPDYIVSQLLNDPSSHVLKCLRKRGYKTRPIFLKPKRVVGNHLVFRNATTEDATFILSLRTDPVKSKHLSQTTNELNKQIDWLERYAIDDQQIYFVIFDEDDRRVGTVRLYDQIEDSFCWGSWILKEGTPSSYSIESALLVYHFALKLGFRSAHFDVRKANQSVWRFHERFGAIRVKETAEDFLYNISQQAIERSMERYKRFLPHGAAIDY